MSARIVLAVAQKELRELLRDRRTLLFLVVLPVLLYPLLMLVFARAGEAGMRSLDEQQVTVARAGPLPEDVEAALAALEKVDLVDASTLPEGADVDAVVRVAPPAEPSPLAPVQVEVDRAREIASIVEERVVAALRRAREEARDERLRAHGVPAVEAEVAAVEVVDTSTRERRGGFLFGRIAAPLLIFMLIMGAYTPAADATAGERERQTLRTLLCAPVDARLIAAGKLLSTSLVALLAALSNLAGLAVTMRSGLGQGLTLSISLAEIAPIVLVLVPTAVYVGALLLAGAATARSIREAQALLSPLILVVGMPAFGVALPGVPASPALALLPVFGPALVLREILAGSATPLLVAAGVGGALALTVVSLGLAARAFTVEALMSGRIQAPSRAPGPLPAFDAVLLAIALFGGAMVAGGLFASRGLVALLVATQVLVFAGLPVALALLRSSTPRRALGLVLPSGPGAAPVTAGALLLVPSLLVATEALARALAPLDPRMIETAREMAAALDDLSAPALFLLIAVLPAVAEEIAFRGALLRAWSARPVLAVAATAAVFSALHGSIARVPPTLALGLLAGLVALRTRSVLPAIALHAAHNGLAVFAGLVLAERHGEEAAHGFSLATVVPAWAHVGGAIGAALLALGLVRGRRNG